MSSKDRYQQYFLRENGVGKGLKKCTEEKEGKKRTGGLKGMEEEEDKREKRTSSGINGTGCDGPTRSIKSRQPRRKAKAIVVRSLRVQGCVFFALSQWPHQSSSITQSLVLLSQLPCSSYHAARGDERAKLPRPIDSMVQNFPSIFPIG
ncbi:hypothetical protein FRC16_004965 [Serendipita sp. 398]|nr:hypothetical protein FRC16_004965 [Serendipita sp. 398]